MTRTCLHVIAIVAVVSVLGVNCREYMREKPEYFHSCSTTDPELNKCFRNNMQVLIEHFKEGIPGLPSAGKFEPVKVKRLKIEQNQLKIEMRNMTIAGLGATKLTKVDLNLKDYSYFVEAVVPKLRVDALYKTDGRILFLELKGKGKMWVEADNSVLSMVVKLKLTDDEGLTFADIQHVKTKINSIGSLRANLENLFNGNKELEQNTNAIFNENWRDFFEVMRPTIEDTMDSVVLGRFKKVFSFIPVNYLISNVPTAKEFEEMLAKG